MTDIVTAETVPTLGYIHTDHLGCPAFVTAESGEVFWDGGITTPFGVSVETLGAFTQNLMFPGQYRDAETGYNQNWHRTYDPTLGRYLQSDPIGLAGELNRYAYVGGNSVSYVDPTGLVTLDISFNFDFYFVIGFSIDVGYFYTDETNCAFGEYGFFTSGKIGVGLDASAGLSTGLSSGNPDELFNGVYGEAEVSLGPVALNANGSSGNGRNVGGGAIGLEGGLPIGVNVGVGRSKILGKWKIPNSTQRTGSNICEC